MYEQTRQCEIKSTLYAIYKHTFAVTNNARQDMTTTITARKTAKTFKHSTNDMQIKNSYKNHKHTIQ